MNTLEITTESKRELRDVETLLQQARTKLNLARNILTPFAPKKSAVIEHLEDSVAKIANDVVNLRGN